MKITQLIKKEGIKGRKKNEKKRKTSMIVDLGPNRSIITLSVNNPEGSNEKQRLSG